MQTTNRRAFLRRLGIGAAAMPFVLNLPSLGMANQRDRKKRLIVMFSPNGVVPSTFWPLEHGEDFKLPESLTPLEPLKNRTLVLKGVCDKVRGDGDNHMRGIGCLLTGIELFPGNIQGGSDTPAGWSSGLSIDQEIKNYLQASDSTRTRFGSLEFGVMVPDRADTWTRMVYAGPNKPIAPIDDPYQMFAKLYGRVEDTASLKSVLDDVQEDLQRGSKVVSKDDRRLLEEHATFVREMEQELKAASEQKVGHAMPELETGVREMDDNLPRLSKMQIDLLVNSYAGDFARVGTQQYTHSESGAKMRFQAIEEGHHQLSHEPDTNESAQEKLTKIIKWYCEQLVYLATRLAETPEPGGPGSLLDNTTIVWTNELGKGYSHTLDNTPFVRVGNGFDFKMGRCLHLPKVPHNRLLLSLAHGMGHKLERFGNPDYCGDGVIGDLT